MPVDQCPECLEVGGALVIFLLLLVELGKKCKIRDCLDWRDEKVGLVVAVSASQINSSSQNKSFRLKVTV